MKKITENLIKKAQCGDMNALDIILEEFSKIAYYHSVKILKNYDDANDCVQLSLNRLVISIHKYDSKISSFNLWCHSIVENEIHNYMRTSKRYQSRVVNDEESVYNIADDAFTDNLMSMLSDLEKQIGEEKYKVLFYKIGLKYSFQELTEIFDCSLSTIKRKYSEALNEAKKYIEGKKNE